MRVIGEGENVVKVGATGDAIFIQVGAYTNPYAMAFYLPREEAIEWGNAILYAVRDMDDARKEREGATAGTDAATPDV